MMADQSSAKESPSQSLQVTEGIVDTEEKQTPSSGSTSSTPPWVRWSRGLHSLLDDTEGVELFELYLSQEGCSAQLNFLWACEGLKSTGSDDPPKIPQLVRSIYRNLIQNSNLLGVGEDTRSGIAQSIKEGKFNTEIFDKARAEVEIHMQDNLYPNFMKSEIFLSVATGELETSTRSEEVHGSTSSLESGIVGANVSASASLSAAERSQSQTDRILSGVATKLQVDPLTGEIIHSATTQADGELSPLQISSPSTPPSSSNAAIALNLLPNQLQTVHEDKELSVNPPPPPQNAKTFKLTKEVLRATQRSRASAVSVPGAVPVLGNGKVRKGETLSGHYYTNKGALTTAAFPYHVMYSDYNPVSRVDSEIQSMSSDAMTDDGGHHHSSSKKHGHHHHKSQHSQSQLPPSSRHLEKLSQFPGGAAAVGVQNKDNLTGLRVITKEIQAPKKDPDPKEFAAVLIRKLEEVKKKRELEEKLNRRISERNEGPCTTEGLTSHVLAAAIEKLQVQDEGLPDDILDKHVSRIWKDITPDPRSPKLRSPTAGRRRGIIPQLSSGVLMHRQRRDRDVVSTFSADSGNVNDYVPEAPNSPSIMFIPKSRSVPYDLKGSDEQLKKIDHSQFPMSSQGQRGRSSRGNAFGQSDPRKMSATILTKRSSNEYLDSGISVVSGTVPQSMATPAAPYDWSRVDQWVTTSQHACDEKQRVRSTTSPTILRRQKKTGGSASSSQSQPSFQPTPTSMEEVCRRLNKKPPNYLPQHQLPGTLSSTLPRRHHSQPHSTQEESFFAGVTEFSVSSFVFYEDSEVPYGFKIPCKSRSGGITLAVFKEHLPKRGHFRFFFKKECAELDTKVVQEEVTDDCQILPLYEGKIIAHLQAATTSSSSSLQQNAPLL